MYPNASIEKSCAVIYTNKEVCGVINPTVWEEIKSKDDLNWQDRFHDFSTYFIHLCNYIQSKEAERISFQNEKVVSLYRGGTKFSAGFLEYFKDAQKNKKGVFHNSFFSASLSPEV